MPRDATLHTDTRLDELIPTLTAGGRFTEILGQPRTAGTVSALIATYNRCPHAPDGPRRHDNPLGWALQALRGQAGDALAEIVVVDDASTDHTPAVLARHQRLPGVRLRSIRLPRHRGAWAARNTAARAARGRWLLYGDDDCVFAPHAASGAAYLMDILQRHDPAAAALMLPFYYRSLRPREVTDQIGTLSPATAQFTTGFHAWPATYLPDPPRLDHTGMIAPLPVELIAGTALIDKATLATAGGFTDLSAWASSYSDHLHLSADLTDTGAHLYHCPDPRLAAAHLKFGAIGRFGTDPADLDTIVPGLARPLRGLVEASALPRTDTGARVRDAAFHAEMIGSFFVFFAGRSLAGGTAWGVRTWAEFVRQARVWSATVTTHPDRAQRCAAWRAGLARGAQVLIEQARPRRTAQEVAAVLSAVCERAGQPRLTGW